MFSPRPEAELKRLQELVANTVGFDNERRDSITVSSLAFNNINVNETQEPVKPWYDLKELSEHGIRNGMIALVVIIFFFMVLRPFLKWTMAPQEKREDPGSVSGILPKTVSELESGVNAGALPAPSGVTELSVFSGGRNTEDRRILKAETNTLSNSDDQSQGAGNADDLEKPFNDRAMEEDLKTKILERLQVSPKKGIRVVQEWLEEVESRVAEG